MKKLILSFVLFIIILNVSYASSSASISGSCKPVSFTCTDIKRTFIYSGVEWIEAMCPDVSNPGFNSQVDILAIDLDNPNIKVVPGVARDHNLHTLKEIGNNNDNIIAGINGGFFYNNPDNFPGFQDPACPGKKFTNELVSSDGVVQINGKSVAKNCDAGGYSRSTLILASHDGHNNPYIEPVLPYSAAINHSDPEKLPDAIGGSPNLVSPTIDNNNNALVGFVNITNEGSAANDEGLLTKNRSSVAIGYDLNNKSKYMFLVTVSGAGEGMTFCDLAFFFLHNNVISDNIKITQAMALDGGGSVSMFIKNHNPQLVVPGMYRKIYDGLFVVKNNA